MAGIGLVVDPTSEDATNTQLDINDTTNFAVVGEPDFTPPDLDPQWASSSDTEGAALAATKHQNRKIVVPLHVYGQTAAGLDTQLAKLQQKTGKILREGGTLKLTVPSGKTAVFDLLDAAVATPIRKRLVSIFIAETTLTFTAKPYGRGTAVTLSAHSETTLPALIFTETGIGGDVPALGRLQITEGQGVDQWWVAYGVQSRYYDSASTAALFYEAEALTPRGGATSVAVTGASGGNAVNGPVSPTWSAVLSTQVGGTGGSHMTHVGGFRVLARVMAKATNAATVSFGFEWSVGDLRHPTRNDETFTITRQNAGRWCLADLGTVQIDKIPRGTQRWEGRILATGSTPDQVYVDYLLLVPVDATGELRAVPPTAAPSLFDARDEFDQLIGTALTGSTAPVGGTWQGGGSSPPANDFILASGHVAQRAGLFDGPNTPCRVWLTGTGGRQITLASIDFMTTSLPVGANWSPGLLLRADFPASNHNLRVFVSNSDTPGTDTLSYGLFSTDTDVTVDATYQPNQVVPVPIPDLEANTWYTLRAFVDNTGRLFAWFGPRGGTLTQYLQTYDGRLAIAPPTGWGNGAAGFFDLKTDNNAQTRQYDNFWTITPPWDAAMFASRQAEIREASVIRQDSTGAIWAPASVFEGDYLRIQPAGQEGRTNRIVVKACRNDPVYAPDPAIDDISATLTVIPRYLELPE